MQHNEDFKMSTPPDLWLEDIYGQEAQTWVRRCNKQTLEVIESEPRYRDFSEFITQIIQDKQRVATGTIINDHVYNFWQDQKNIRGVLRRIHLKDYIAKREVWEVIIDIDKLAKIEDENWVYNGFVQQIPKHHRILLQLSKGGGDSFVIREFDLETKTFISVPSQNILHFFRPPTNIPRKLR